jgi:hypothetical protein
MTQETEALFEALFALEDAREVLRQTAPKHKLSDGERKAFKGALGKAKAAIERLERL